MDTKEAAKELGRAGGKKTLQRHGKQHFKDMIAKRWRESKAKGQAQTDTLCAIDK